LAPFEETVYEIAVLALVPVVRGFVCDHGQEALFGVLLLNQILAGLTRDAAAEEELDTTLQ
jgi:hypothetical protein